MYIINAIKKISLQLCLLLIILSACRAIFLFLNFQYYPAQQESNILYLLLVGARFDWATLIYFNIPYLIICFLTDTRIVKSDLLLKINQTLFVFLNVLIILINTTDIVYYRFVFQRSTYETLSYIKHSLPVIWDSIFGFWYILLFAIAAVSLFIILNRVILSSFSVNKEKVKPSRKRIFFQYTLSFLVAIISARGMNTFSLTPSSANLYVKTSFVSLVSNSAFDILFSFIKHDSEIPAPHFTGADSLLFNNAKKLPYPTDPDTINKKNIIVFVLESFSKNYLMAGHKHKANTPFIDSLMQKSVVCNNAFANGVMSINGLNSIIGGIPPIAFQTLTNSPYQNTIKARTGLILESKGYSTHFFFGSNDDHYGFKRLTRQLGISNYYGKKEFGNDSLDDGMWGIYDMPFFEYAAGVLKKEKLPFFSVIFNLSSHFPYTVPEPYKSALPAGPLNSSQSVSYVDKSIEKFFEKISNEKWFPNTLFVFVADHWSHEDNAKGEVGVARYQIPLFFYTPDGSLHPQSIDYVCDQLDVVPTIMDVLHISERNKYLGKSVFDTTGEKHFSCAMLHFPDIIQLTNDSLTLQFDIRRDSAVGLFQYKKDPEQKNNLVFNFSYNNELKAMENLLKRHLMRYYAFIKNDDQ